MRLLDLQPEFVRREVRDCRPGPDCSVISPHTEHEVHARVDSIAEADGVLFLCPKCFAANGSSDVGTHWVLCWRPRVPADVSPKPGRWEFEGTGHSDLTLRAGSSSVLLTGGGCEAHFFVRGGEIVGC